jgi:hypothetical protein
MLGNTVVIECLIAAISALLRAFRFTHSSQCWQKKTPQSRHAGVEQLHSMRGGQALCCSNTSNIPEPFALFEMVPRQKS